MKAADARQWVRTCGYGELVDRMVDAAPPLTADQRARLAAILATRGVPNGGAA